jgi:hypothetical protein
MAPAIADALSRLGRARSLIAACLLGLLAVCGWFAAQAALGLDRNRPTNVYWLLGGVLLPQTLLLLVWLILTISGALAPLGAGAAGALRALVMRMLSGRLGRHAAGAAAVAAVSRSEASGPMTRWSLALATNALWSSFNLGTLAGVLALLSVQQHTFCWESTIFSAEGYQRITAAIAVLPSTLGFSAPDAGQIEAGRLDPTDPSGFPPQDEATRMAWSGLLVGSVVAYGLLPRALLTLFSAAMLRWTRRGIRLDLDSPLLAPWAARLTSARFSSSEEGEAAWPTPGAALDDASDPAPPSPGGRPAIVGLELSVPACGWPPSPLSGIEVIDLGRVESREDRHAAANALSALGGPHALTVIASLTSTPDRGLASLLGSLSSAARRPPALILTGGSAMRGRGDSSAIEQRSADWRALAADAGIPPDRVREIDLDGLTADSSAQLRALVLDGAAPSLSRRLERAAALIAECADQWARQGNPPSLAAQATLHRALAELYGADAPGSPWRRLLRLESAGALRFEAAAAAASVPDSAPWSAGAASPLAGLLERSSQRVTALLPPSLRVRPRWIAAGALAGALGCVAVGLAGPAALAAPLALQALPIWSAIGAAVGAVFSAGQGPDRRRAAGQTDPEQSAAEDPLGWAGALRAATLQALLMELQGGGEARLSRSLEMALPEPDPLSPLLLAPAPGVAGQWLDAVRHRLDVALLSPAASISGPRVMSGGQLGPDPTQRSSAERGGTP